MRRFLALIVLDGWGISNEKEFNAIALAKTPTMDFLLKNYPNTKLACSGEEVGLPKGQMGNSEVGHLNIGAGRVVYQEMVRISKSIETQEIFSNSVLIEAIENAKQKNAKLHLIGLVSDGGVHSLNTHLYALLKMAKLRNMNNVIIHAFLDGRDTPPESGADYIRELQNEIKKQGLGRISTIMGRYYSMDRDKRWDRVKRAYDAMVNGIGKEEENPVEAVKKSYLDDKGDEFVEPVVMKNAGLIEDNDSVICFNFRADRVREITEALTNKNFLAFERNKFPSIHYVCMTEYKEDFNLPVVFKQLTMRNILANVFEQEGVTNLRIAETEKYAHVTFFFNGGDEHVFKGENRILIPSSKIATYDLKPEMSAYEIEEKFISELRSNKYNVIICNFANPDMVGHTGKLDATILAVETVDKCLEKILKEIKKINGIAIVTADHGNAEKMMENGHPHTAHTTNLVPCILVDDNFHGKLNEGSLRDIAPTILAILGINKPSEMTGSDLRYKGA